MLCHLPLMLLSLKTVNNTNKSYHCLGPCLNLGKAKIYTEKGKQQKKLISLKALKRGHKKKQRTLILVF